MASLFQRLVDLGRAHLNGLFTAREPEASTRTVWETDFKTQEQSRDDASTTASSFEEPASAGHGLPHSDELVRCYRLLDLPFGTPLAQVTKQWKAYLRRCHPDRHANDPAKEADATFLTQQLNDAYRKITQAWKRHQR